VFIICDVHTDQVLNVYQTIQLVIEGQKRQVAF